MFKPFSLNIHGRLIEYDRPAVMGIINVTPDSFYAGSRVNADEIGRRVRDMMGDGADMIDIGGYSSRPGAAAVSETEEIDRLAAGISALREVSPDIVVSVDTFRASVAKVAIEQMGADIINDISGGDLDDGMFETVAALNVPYILMHMRGTPADMQTLTDYPDGVTAEVLRDLSVKLRKLRLAGVNDVIVDPGFGFAKTLEQNYRLMADMPMFAELLDAPVLVGISRKSMVTRCLGVPASDALNGTTALNTIALLKGAQILRVHDVKACAEAVRIVSMLPQ
ncbi:MAG: dihydropteroate synthase [Candidatus Amulumruptor sp.]